MSVADRTSAAEMWPEQPSHIGTEQPRLLFRAPDAEASLPLEDVIEIVDLVETLRLSSGAAELDELAELLAFADRIDLQLVPGGASDKVLHINAAEESLLNLLVAQPRIRAAQPPSDIFACPDCRTRLTELLLTRCPHCRHDFLADAGVEALWRLPPNQPH